MEIHESMKIKPSRLIRNIVLMEAESKMRFINIASVRAYRKYLEITNPEELKKINGTRIVKELNGSAQVRSLKP